MNDPAYHFEPLTVERWKDLEILFGPRGACAGCWCMYWRLRRSEFDRNKGEGNRQALQAIVEAGEVPGLIAYAGEAPAGWCSFGPRPVFSTLGRSRILKPVDEQPVWSIVCFFVAKEHRHKGLTVKLLEAAAVYARKHGATVLEGYPEDPAGQKLPAVFAYTGLASAFLKAGFTEVARRSPKRPIMRRSL